MTSLCLAPGTPPVGYVEEVRGPVLDIDCERLRLAYNAQRQEEITEEIEIILLSVDMMAEYGTAP